jgi:hypothetical protein
MTLKRDQIELISGNYFKTVSGRTEMTFSPIPALSSLALSQGITVDPPAGEFVLYPFNLEYIFKLVSGPKGVGKYIGFMHFSDSVGNPSARLSLTNTINMVPGFSGDITLSTISVDSSGLVSISMANGHATDAGWAKTILTLGGPFITIATTP